ncbi:MAG: AAA family ATPase [Chitinispirillia bacterium]|nr:AAA family ATPase [Chitinispirillia bacterium]
MESTSNSMFITGKAGTGKSYLLRYFKEQTKKDVAVVAPTGLAAINIGGQTIHSFFQIAPGLVIPEKIAPLVDWPTSLVEKLKKVETVVIDEVSMVRVDLMDGIDQKLRMVNRGDLPFGGKQIIMIGDPYQLPPVLRDRDGNNAEVRYLRGRYQSRFFFSAPSVKDIPVYELSNVHRQGKGEFLDILNKTRIDQVTNEDLAILNQRCYRGLSDQHSPRLVPTNNAARLRNEEKLDELPGRASTYRADIVGKYTRDEYPADEFLKLKVGAQVVMLANDRSHRWVNGSLGVITRLGTEVIGVKIGKLEHNVETRDWEKFEYVYDKKTKELVQERVGLFRQFPMRLAWAMTIHRSQGQTYESVAIDMGWRGAFDFGQTYVALSRCVSMDNLHLVRRILRRDIMVHPAVMGFMGGVDTPTIDKKLNRRTRRLVAIGG